jgi:hypothetical protein
MIMFGSFLPSVLGWFGNHQSLLGSIVMESITLICRPETAQETSGRFKLAFPQPHDLPTALSQLTRHFQIAPHVALRHLDRPKPVVNTVYSGRLHISDKRAVDFQLADRKLFQVTEAKIAGPKIVNRQLQPPSSLIPEERTTSRLRSIAGGVLGAPVKVLGGKAGLVEHSLDEFMEGRNGYCHESGSRD